MDYEHARYMISVAQLAVSALGFILAMIQLQRVYKQAKESYAWNVRAKALDFLDGFDDYHAIYRDLVQYEKNHPGLLLQKYLEDPVYRFNFIKMMNYFEKVAAAIKHNMCDEDIAYDVLRAVFVGFWDSRGAAYREMSKNKSYKCYELFDDQAEKWKLRYNDEIKKREAAAKSAGSTPPKTAPYGK